MKTKAVFLISLLLFVTLLCSCVKIRIPSSWFGGAATETESEAEEEYTGEVKAPFYDGAERYAYVTLDAEQKQLYDKILDAALSLDEYVSITDTKAAEYVYNAVFFDCAELFYLSQTPGFDTGKLVFNYVFSRSQINEISTGLDRAFNEFKTTKLSDGMSEYDVFFTIYTYIINITKYAFDESDLFEENVFNTKVYRAMCAAGPLIDRTAICTGYARATQYMCQRLGITCFTVNGRGSGGLHYFNIVKLNGEYYYSDTTWGDPVGQDRSKDYLTYYYFCTTTEETFRSHVVESVIPMPLCTATECNYYVRNGLTADTSAEIAKMAYAAYKRQESEIRIKVDHEKLNNVYSEMKAAINEVFVNNGELNVKFSVSKSDGPSLISVFFK